MRKKTSAQELDLLIQQPEITIEFKEARSQFGRDDVLKYVVALANERGGKLVLGVSDKKPGVSSVAERLKVTKV
jgi:ATP-dependent DNA helicase RecG